MKAAYLDSSCLVALALDEPGGRQMAARLEQLDEVYSSNLLEAEFRSVLLREAIDEGEELLTRITWILPDRPLSPEMRRVLQSGHLRGADLWHLATALYVAEQPPELPFLTLDRRQREVADRMGFPDV